MFDPSKFTVAKSRPLPVFLLLDVSGSMSGEKIQNLNDAVETMLEAFVKQESKENEIHISVITFGEEVKLNFPLSKSSEITWNTLHANGMTPMGTALKLAKSQIEDKNIITSRSYKPTVVLVSDGQPNDDWKNPMDDFINNGRTSKCDRMAMAIGKDADESVLKLFIQGTGHQLFYAGNAATMHEFFQKVTMSVKQKTVSKDPNDQSTFVKITANTSNISSEDDVW